MSDKQNNVEQWENLIADLYGRIDALTYTCSVLFHIHPDQEKTAKAFSFLEKQAIDALKNDAKNQSAYAAGMGKVVSGLKEFRSVVEVALQARQSTKH